ncbi:MAG TPA: response regulator transcription factor [Chthoniobacterales bacterium]
MLIVDRYPVVRDGLRFALASLPDYEVCGEAENLREARAFLGSHSPEVIILDLVLGGRDCGEAIEELRRIAPDSHVLVFSGKPEELFAPRAIRAGASGYLMKTDGAHALKRALAEILAGGIYLSPRMRAARRPPRQDLEQLTERELQIFLRLGEGKTTGEVASELHLSAKTVATHRENIKAKLGIGHGAELTRRAIVHTLAAGGSVCAYCGAH